MKETGYCKGCCQFAPCDCGLVVISEPPDELTKLKSDVERLRGALKPFAKWGSHIKKSGYFSNHLVFMTYTDEGELKVSIDDLDEAARVLEETK